MYWTFRPAFRLRYLCTGSVGLPSFFCSWPFHICLCLLDFSAWLVRLFQLHFWILNFIVDYWSSVEFPFAAVFWINSDIDCDFLTRTLLGAPYCLEDLCDCRTALISRHPESLHFRVHPNLSNLTRGPTEHGWSVIHMRFAHQICIHHICCNVSYKQLDACPKVFIKPDAPAVWEELPSKVYLNLIMKDTMMSLQGCLFF